MLADEIAERVAGIRFDDIPTAVTAAAAAHLLDALGVAVAAAGSADARRRAHAFPSGSDSTVVGQPARRTAAAAALLNGMLVHSLEYDDTHVPSVIHGSAVVAPTALAVGEREHVSGRDALTAIVLGWELLVRLGLASPGGFQAVGFQTTAVAGPFAAAAIAGRLTNVSPDVLANALGIAGSQASGTFEAVVGGASVKAMHPGWAAQSGIVATDLARFGVTGPSSVFEGRYGFFRTYARDQDGPERLTVLLEDFGARWYLPEAAFKLHPCCHYIHAFLECCTLLLQQGLRHADVREVRCRVPREEAGIICEPWSAKQRPSSVYEARFSLPFCVASLLCVGRLDEESLRSTIDDPSVRRLAEAVTWEPWDDSGFPERFPAAVEVVTGDAGRRHVEVADVFGSAARPAALPDVIGKFENNVSAEFDAAAASRLIDTTLNLSSCGDLNDFLNQFQFDRPLRKGSG